MKYTQQGSLSILSSVLGLLSALPMAHAQTGEVSFTPTGIKIPVMKITLSKTDQTEEQALYTCEMNSEAECLVDLTNQTALDTLAAAAGSAVINVGTYDQIKLYTCADGKNGLTPVTAYIKGTFTAASTTYYTDADPTVLGGLNTAGPAAFTQVGNWSCATKVLNVNPGIEVTKDSTIDLTVLVDNTLAGFSTPNTSSGMGGCKAANGGLSRGICMTYPALIPVLDKGRPTTQRYLLAHSSASIGAIVDSTANAMVIVALDSQGKPLLGFGRTIYSETSAAQNSNSQSPSDTITGGPSFVTETEVSSFKVNADQSIAFRQGASADTYAAAFTAFQLADHTGIDQTRSGVAWYYHAIPMP